jgi:hypothetical protein
MMRVLAIAGGWLLLAKLTWANPNVEPTERSRIDPVLAKFLLSTNLPLVNQKMREHTSLANSHQQRIRQSATEGLQKDPTKGKSSLPNLRRNLVSRFVPTRSHSTSFMGADMEIGESLSAEWNKMRADRATHMGRVDDIIRGVSTVWVLISNLGNSREAIHVMKGEVKRWPEPSFILAFEHPHDAKRYAGVATTAEFQLTPVEWPLQQLRDFCRFENFEVAFARNFVIPPTTESRYEYDVYTKAVRLQQPRASPDAYAPDARHRGGPHALDSVMGQPHKGMEGVSKLWVVMINPGQANEGVYTLQDLEQKKQDRILAFEQRDDAKRFADKLKGFDMVAPMQWDSLQLNDFCKHGGFETDLISAGASISPPEVNEFDVDTSSRPGGAPARAGVDDEESLPLHRRLHLQNLRALLEYRLRQSQSENKDESKQDYDPEEWQA